MNDWVVGMHVAHWDVGPDAATARARQVPAIGRKFARLCGLDGPERGTRLPRGAPGCTGKGESSILERAGGKGWKGLADREAGGEQEGAASR